MGSSLPRLGLFAWLVRVALGATVSLIPVSGKSANPDSPDAPSLRAVVPERPVGSTATRRVTCPSPDELRAWARPLGEIGLDVGTARGSVPIDCSQDVFTSETSPHSGRHRIPGRESISVHWKPTELAYQPLYFDDVPLERYGQSSWPLAQPLFSGAHFFGIFAIIPYKMGIDRTHDPVYTLGYYRPGSNAPCVRQRLPFEWDAALFEAGAWTGLVFIVP